MEHKNMSQSSDRRNNLEGYEGHLWDRSHSPSVEDDRRRMTIFCGRQPLSEDKLRRQTTLGRRWPSEDLACCLLWFAIFFRQLGRLVNDCPSDIGWNIGLELYISLMNFTDGLVFLQFWVLRQYLRFIYKNLFLLHLNLLFYWKCPSQSHGFNAKIGLKKDQPWAEIFEKNHFWLKVWFGTLC